MSSSLSSQDIYSKKDGKDDKLGKNLTIEEEKIEDEAFIDKLMEGPEKDFGNEILLLAESPRYEEDVICQQVREASNFYQDPELVLSQLKADRKKFPKFFMEKS